MKAIRVKSGTLLITVVTVISLFTFFTFAGNQPEPVVKTSSIDKSSISINVDANKNYEDAVAENLHKDDRVNVMLVGKYNKGVSDDFSVAVIGPVCKHFVSSVKDNGYVVADAEVVQAGAKAGEIIKVNNEEKLPVIINNDSKATAKTISAAVCCNVEEDVTLPLNGEFRVPTVHNGQKVAKAVISTSTIYNVKSFEVEEGVENSTLKHKAGKGSVKIPAGFSFHVEYTYK